MSAEEAQLAWRATRQPWSHLSLMVPRIPFLLQHFVTYPPRHLLNVTMAAVQRPQRSQPSGTFAAMAANWSAPLIFFSFVFGVFEDFPKIQTAQR